MEALYSGREFVANDPPESVANILGRYAEIDESFPEELRQEALPYFVRPLVPGRRQPVFEGRGRASIRPGWTRPPLV